MILQINAAIAGFWILWGIIMLVVGVADEKSDVPLWVHKAVLGFAIGLGIASTIVMLINIVNALANL